MRNYTVKITVEGFSKVSVYENDSKELIRDILTPVLNSADNKIMRMPTNTDTSGNRIDLYYVHNVIWNYMIEVITRVGAPE